MKILCAIGVALILQAPPVADLKVERKVEGQTLVSDSLPTVRLAFARPFKYVGAQKFVLYNIATAEQHFFVDADKDGNIQRMYWLQFEGYLPTNTNHYDANNPRTTKIADIEFLHDTKLFTDYAAAESESKPDSDSAYMVRFLASKNLKVPKSVERIRMFDYAQDKRSELMLIYIEALKPGELPPGITGVYGETPADDTYPAVAARTLEHMKANVKIQAR